jgi:hypothetical protein
LFQKVDKKGQKKAASSSVKINEESPSRGDNPAQEFTEEVTELNPPNPLRTSLNEIS